MNDSPKHQNDASRNPPLVRLYWGLCRQLGPWLWKYRDEIPQCGELAAEFRHEIWDKLCADGTEPQSGAVLMELPRDLVERIARFLEGAGWDKDAMPLARSMRKQTARSEEEYIRPAGEKPQGQGQLF